MDAEQQVLNALEGLKKALDRLEKASIIHQQMKNAMDEVVAERDRLLLLEGASVDSDKFIQLKAERDELFATRNRLVGEKNKLLKEREELLKTKDGWAKERPLLLKAKESLEEERLRLTAERDRLIAEKNQISSAKETIKIQDSPENLEKIEALKKTIEEQKKNYDALIHKEAEEKERLAIELDGVKRAYGELKETAKETFERLETTIAQLKELREES